MNLLHTSVYSISLHSSSLYDIFFMLFVTSRKYHVCTAGHHVEAALIRRTHVKQDISHSLSDSQNVNEDMARMQSLTPHILYPCWRGRRYAGRSRRKSKMAPTGLKS